MKVINTFTFCCDNLWKSKFVALEKPGKLRNFFSYALWPPWIAPLIIVCISAADQSRIMQDQMTGPAMGMPPDPSKAFKVYFVFIFVPFNFYYAAILYAALPVCLSVRLSVLYRLVTRKQTQKNQKGKSGVMFTYRWQHQWIKCGRRRLHTRPTPLLGLLYCRHLRPWATGWSDA